MAAVRLRIKEMDQLISESMIISNNAIRPTGKHVLRPRIRGA